MLPRNGLASGLPFHRDLAARLRGAPPFSLLRPLVVWSRRTGYATVPPSVSAFCFISGFRALYSSTKVKDFPDFHSSSEKVKPLTAVAFG